MAATNKCLAQSNKSRTGYEATKKRESSVSLHTRREMTKEETPRIDHRFRSTCCATAHHEKYTEKRILAVKVTRNSIEATSTT